VSFGTKWVPAQDLAAWLLKGVYHRPLWDWIFEASLWGLPPALLLYCPREGSAVFETGRMSSGKLWA